MAVGHVRADDEEHVGAVEVGVRPGRAVRAERLLVAGARTGHAQPRVGLDVHRSHEALGQLVRQILRLDRHLAGHVERDGVRAVLVDDRAQPSAGLGDGVVDGCGDGFVVACRAQQRRRQPAVVGGHQLGVRRALGAQPPEVGGVQLVAEDPRDDGPARAGIRRGLHFDAAADAAVRARRPVTAMKLMVGGQCFGLFSDDVIGVKIDAHRAPEAPGEDRLRSSNGWNGRGTSADTVVRPQRLCLPHRISFVACGGLRPVPGLVWLGQRRVRRRTRRSAIVGRHLRQNRTQRPLPAPRRSLRRSA